MARVSRSFGIFFPSTVAAMGAIFRSLLFLMLVAAQVFQPGRLA